MDNPTNMATESGYKIYTYGRGFVVVAHTDHTTRGVDEFGVHFYCVSRSIHIRQWGSTKLGLSLLTQTGPRAETVLDANPCLIYIPILAIHDIRVVQQGTASARWEKAINEAYVRMLECKK